MNRVDDFSIVTVDRRDVPMFVMGLNADSREEWLDVMAFASRTAAKMEGLDCRVFLVEHAGCESDWLVAQADSEGVGHSRFVCAHNPETAVSRAWLDKNRKPF